MNDSELMQELHIAIEQFTDGVSAPAWLPARARRIGQRRAITRTVGAGGSVVAVAGLVTVLATSSGVPAAVYGEPANLPHTQDTAYVVRHVRAALAATTVNVTESVLPDREQDWMYVDPSTGVQYQRDIYPHASASSGSVTGIIATPVNGYLHFNILTVDHTDRTWSESKSVASAPIPTGVTTGSIATDDTPQELRQALADAGVPQMGTTTVNGTTAIALSFPASGSVTVHTDSQSHRSPFKRPTTPSSHDRTATATVTLYVDSQSYQPLREVTATPTAGGVTETSMQNWLPATPANIALTKLTVPLGYTEDTPSGP